MNQNFDAFGVFEKPTFILCNPDREMLYAMGEIYDTNVSLRYNSLSEFSFKVPAKVNDEDTAYYSMLEYPRMVYIEDTGYFYIRDIDGPNDGVEDYKNITCYSAEFIFMTKKLNLFKGTYKFYDLIDPTGTLMQLLIQYVPGWTIGTVDASLLGKYRTFDEADTNIYSLLMGPVETAYQCVFVFDTINKTVSAVVPTQASATTDIYFSHDNLLQKTNLKPITEELVTALSVYGAGDLAINSVNPLGTNTIYNFDYFKTTDWMDQTLIDSINAWEANISSSQVAFTALLTTLRDLNETLVTQQGELVDLQSEWDALEGVRRARIEGGLAYTDINAQIAAKDAEISSKESEISATEVSIESTNASVTAINSAVSFANNFSASQIADLSNFIFGNTYLNENFVQTDLMTNAQIQDMAQELYDQAQAVLAKVSVPRYTFTVDTVNFLFLEEYGEFVSQLALGSTTTVQPSETQTLYPALLEMEFSYDDPTKFNLTFSNRLSLADNDTIYTDFFEQAHRAATTTTFNSENWGSWNNNYKDDVSDFINSALDASLNNLISSSNQEILINQNGLKGKRYLPETDDYSPEQIWLTSNTIAFTTDNWATASLALGKIVTEYGTAYGLVAEVIVGNLIAGNNLTITNENNSFIIDGDGVRIYDATIDITTTNGRTRIILDPVNGIKILGKNGVWTEKFFADDSGNLTFSGALSGATGDFTGRITANEGSFGGITITADGIQKDANNYIRSNGDFKWGMLTMIGSNAYFNGNIYANNLLGLVQSYQIGSVNADTINTGTLTAIDIYGSSIYWDDVVMHATGTGAAEIAAADTLLIRTGQQSFLSMRLVEGISIGAKLISIGWTPQEGIIKMKGTIYTKDANNSEGYGVSESFMVQTPGGSKTLSFINGMLTVEAPTGSIPPINPGDDETFFTETGFTVVIPTTAGKVADIELPFNFVIDSVRLVASKPDVIGDAEIDISLKPFATWNLASEASIVGSSPVAIVNGKKYEDTTLDGWTTTFSKGDYLTIDLVSSNTFTQLELSIKGRK